VTGAAELLRFCRGMVPLVELCVSSSSAVVGQRPHRVLHVTYVMPALAVRDLALGMVRVAADCAA